MSLRKRLSCVSCSSTPDQHVPNITHIKRKDKTEIAETDIVAIDAKKYKKALHKNGASKKSKVSRWFTKFRNRLKMSKTHTPAFMRSKKYTSHKGREVSMKWEPGPGRSNESKLEHIHDASSFQEEQNDGYNFEHDAIIHQKDIIVEQPSSSDQPLLCVGSEKPEFIKSGKPEFYNTASKSAEQKPRKSKQRSCQTDLTLIPRAGEHVSKKLNIPPSFDITHSVFPFPTAPREELVNENRSVAAESETPPGICAYPASPPESKSSQLGKSEKLNDHRSLVTQQQTEELQQFKSDISARGYVVSKVSELPCDRVNESCEMQGQKYMAVRGNNENTNPKQLHQAQEASHTPASDEIAEVDISEEIFSREDTQLGACTNQPDESPQNRIIKIVPNDLGNKLASLKGVAMFSPRKNALCIYVRPNTEECDKEEVQRLMKETSIKYEIKEHSGTLKLNNSKGYPFMGGRLSGSGTIGTAGGFVIDEQKRWYVLTNRHVLEAVMSKGSDVCTTLVDANEPLIINDSTDFYYGPNIGNHEIDDARNECYTDIGILPMSKKLYPKKNYSRQQFFSCPHYLDDRSVKNIELKSVSKLTNLDDMHSLIGKTVYKYGQGVKKAKGEIVDVNTTYIAQDTRGNICKIYKNCIIIKNSCRDRTISDAGDSGALYITEDGGAVAMHFATVTDYDVNKKDETVAVAFPFYLVFKVLKKHTDKNMGLVIYNSTTALTTMESGYAATEVSGLHSRLCSLALQQMEPE